MSMRPCITKQIKTGLPHVEYCYTNMKIPALIGSEPLHDYATHNYVKFN